MVIFGVLMKKETENIRPHLSTRPARGFGVGGNAQAKSEEEELWQKVSRRAQGMDRQNAKCGGQGARGAEQVGHPHPW